MNKTNIYFFQFNFKYGNSVYIPYSVGMIWAYCKQFKLINENFDNKEFIIIRDDPKKIVDSLINPKIAAFSTYVWNWEMSCEVAKEIKNRYPDCLIIFGGPQIPNDMDNFFDNYSFIDLTIHGEGELTFYEVLEQYLTYKNYNEILGLSYNKKGKISLFKRREKIKDLNLLPSPYLTNVFDDLLKLPYEFQALWETNRGCPYSCTYCDWGTADIAKLRLFDIERLKKEIDWFSKNKIDYILGCDANFGIIQRDVDLAIYLANKKRDFGFPKRFRVSFAKNTTERVLHIAEILNEVKLDKGISLSVQSMDDNVLKLIKRTNLKIDSLSDFFKKYQKKGISTFTELILGLPGETYNSFKKGVNTLLISGFHDSLTIYNCSVLPNAQLNDAEYRNFHKIKKLKIPIFLNHSTPGDDPITEYEEIIIGTKDLPTDDWKKQYLFSWIIQSCRALKLTQVLSVYLYYFNSLNYSDFYEELLIFARENPNTIIGQELTFTINKIEKVLSGDNWGVILPNFSNITWSTDEATFLRISEKLDLFYDELLLFINRLYSKFNFSLENDLIHDLIKYQKLIIVKWDTIPILETSLNYPIHSIFNNLLFGEIIKFDKSDYNLKILDNLNFNGDKKKYSTEVLWWGRKGGKFIYQNIIETRLNNK